MGNSLLFLAVYRPPELLAIPNTVPATAAQDTRVTSSQVPDRRMVGCKSWTRFLVMILPTQPARETRVGVSLIVPADFIAVPGVLRVLLPGFEIKGNIEVRVRKVHFQGKCKTVHARCEIKSAFLTQLH